MENGLRNGNKSRTIYLLAKCLYLQTTCQGEDDDNDGIVEDEEEQAEQDAMLVEYAGDLVPSLARTMGGEKFAPYLAGMLQLMVAKTVRQFVTFICLGCESFPKF